MAQPAGRDAELIESKRKLASGRYLRNAWYVAAWADDLGDGQVLGRTILKEPVVLYRMANGEVAAIQNRCSHRFAPLSMGKIVGGNRLQCPYHGLEFDASGACVLNPHGNKHIPSRAHIRGFPVTEKHKAIWIWMGDQPADPAKVPDFSMHGQRAGVVHDQARPHHDQGQLRIDHRQPARPQPHVLFCTTASSATPTRSNPISPSTSTAMT